MPEEEQKISVFYVLVSAESPETRLPGTLIRTPATLVGEGKNDGTKMAEERLFPMEQLRQFAETIVQDLHLARMCVKSPTPATIPE